MPAIEFQTSSAAIESAVSETVMRMKASARDLLVRRAEINRRIHRIQRVMQGLRALAIPHACNGSDARLAEPKRENAKREMEPGLSRACRIALLESSVASLEEIRERIARRGSFSFAEPASPDAAIIRTLNLMVEDGEIRCLEIANQTLWQRIATAEAID